MKTAIKKLDQNPIQSYFRQENLLKGFFQNQMLFIYLGKILLIKRYNYQILGYRLQILLNI